MPGLINVRRFHLTLLSKLYSSMSSEYRIVSDSIGEIKVPAKSYYGAQTERSRQNFNICTDKDRMPTQVIHALAMIKEVAAVINSSQSRMSSNKMNVITEACREIYEGKLDKEFPLVIWQTGSGTQTNMNVNEVVANRASELLEGCRKNNLAIHPNDDVNLGQSSNDIFPTAMNVSIAIEISWSVLPSINYLISELSKKMNETMDIVKIGRTHMQDAVPMTVGQELSGYVDQLNQSKCAIEYNLKNICKLAVGGTAVGTGLNAVEGFSEMVCQKLTELVQKRAQNASVTSLSFTPAENKFAALAGHDALLQLSGCLNTLATVLFRLANDFCLLSSGPRCGFGEFILPANEPGSSIMPGKVNPTQCESLRMVSVQVMSNHFGTSMACSQGQLELNVFKPLIAKNLIHSCELIRDSVRSFADNCVRNMQFNEDLIQTYVDRSLMLVTALTPHIGYDKSAKLAHYAHKNKLSLREAAIELNYLDAAKFDELMKPRQMAFPFSSTK